MNSPSPALPIGAFAAAAGVNVETIRFYQRKGLLPRPRRAHGTVTRYGPADVARVKFIKSAQRLGFSLDEIAGLLALDDGTHCSDARVAAEQKLDDVRGKLDDLRRIESVLAGLVRRCRAGRGTISCPLIAALHEP
jgi:MerR family transcriptional regulator, mercuric resistance operon regulatory protein